MYCHIFIYIYIYILVSLEAPSAYRCRAERGCSPISGIGQIRNLCRCRCAKKYICFLYMSVEQPGNIHLYIDAQDIGNLYLSIQIGRGRVDRGPLASIIYILHIYRYRERRRESLSILHLSLFLSLSRSLYKYIYIYTQREIELRERQSFPVSSTPMSRQRFPIYPTCVSQIESPYLFHIHGQIDISYQPSISLSI